MSKPKLPSDPAYRIFNAYIPFIDRDPLDLYFVEKLESFEDIPDSAFFAAGTDDSIRSAHSLQAVKKNDLHTVEVGPEENKSSHDEEQRKHDCRFMLSKTYV